MRFTQLIWVLIVGIMISTQAVAGSLVETQWLAKNLGQVAVLDVRTDEKSYGEAPIFRKDKKTGNHYLARLGGHIPGASLVAYKNVRGERTINGKVIKYVLPEKSAFEKLMQAAGVNQDSHIVIATNAESDFDLTMAARVFWQLKYFGHDQVSILDGGTAQWLVDRRDYETDASKVKTGNWEATAERKELLATSEEVVAAIDDKVTQLMDVRSLGQYLGTYKSGKVSAYGHIPTAKVFPANLTVTRGAPVKFLDAAGAEKVSHALELDPEHPVIAYCNSGHMASGGWFVMHEILGNKNAKLYDGSMHQWSAEKRPTVAMKLE